MPTSQSAREKQAGGRRPHSGGFPWASCIVMGVVACLSMVLGSPPASPAAPGTSAKPQQAQATPPPATTSQTPRTASGSNNIRVRVQVVNVPVTVLDKHGRPVIGLTKDDFEVYENGVLQSIRYFNIEPKPPLRIGLILDTSNSARRQLSFEKDAASEFVFNILQTRSGQNKIFLQTFDSSSSVAQDFTSDPELLNEKIHSLKAGGGKAFYDSIYFASKEKMLQAGPAEGTRRVLVVISDGFDVQSQHSLEEALSMAHRAETVIYFISNSAYGFTDAGNKFLQEIAEETGGTAFFPLEKTPGTDLQTGYLSHGQIGDTSQNKGLGAETGVYSAERLVHVADSLEAIGRELDDQYTLGYTPKNDAMDGTYRTIKVAVRRKAVEVRAKPGYFAVAD